MVLLVTGLTIGGFYAVLAGALSLTYRAHGFLTLGQAAEMVLGAYAAWVLLNWLGIGFWGALIIVPILVGVVSWLFAVFFIGRNAQNADPLGPTLITLGLTLAVTALPVLLFGAATQSYPSVPVGYTLVLGLPIARFVVLVIAAAIAFAAWIGTKPLGEHDAIAAHPMLISAIASALAGFTAVLMAPIYSVAPNAEWLPAMAALALVIVAGPRSTGRAMMLGLVGGIVNVDVSYYLPGGGDIAVLVLAAIVMLTGPRDETMGLAHVTSARDAFELRAVSLKMIAVLLFAGALLLAILLPNPRFTTWIDVAAFAVLPAGGVALLLRSTGRLSLGHGTLFAVGASATGAAMQFLYMSPGFALLTGIAAATLCGVIVMSAIFRYPTGFSPAITFVLAGLLAQAAYEVPGFDDGLSLATSDLLFGVVDLHSRIATTALLLAVVPLAFLMLLWAGSWRGGSAARQALVTLAASAAIAGLGGALFALVFQYVSAGVFDPVTSVMTSIPGLLGSPALFDGARSLIAVILGAGAVSVGRGVVESSEAIGTFQLLLGVALMFGAQMLSGAGARRPGAAPGAPIRFHG